MQRHLGYGVDALCALHLAKNDRKFVTLLGASWRRSESGDVFSENQRKQFRMPGTASDYV